MTPEQRANYESARAEADAVYSLSMMETNAIVTRARMPACITPCDAHKYAQGKGCECDRLASRASLGMDDEPTEPADPPMPDAETTFRMVHAIEAWLAAAFLATLAAVLGFLR